MASVFKRKLPATWHSVSSRLAATKQPPGGHRRQARLRGMMTPAVQKPQPEPEAEASEMHITETLPALQS